MEYKFLKEELKDNILILTIDKQKSLNALNSQVIFELNNFFTEVEKREDVSVIILTGAGKAFVAGADISEMSTLSASEGSKFAKAGMDAFLKIEKLNIPVIAAVNGFALGGGCELSLSCDIKDLINLIIKLRETLKPTTYLIFPFAEASFIPLLSYLGIDAFNIETAEYYAALNVLISPTKNYDLETYPIYNFTPQGLINYNKKTLDLVLREVREHMHNNSLRNLVEERTNTSPQNTAALRILDKDHSDYLQKYTQLY